MIPLSAGGDGPEILFDPQTSEFYSFAVELEDEQDEILIAKASEIAHSVCPKDPPAPEPVTYVCSKRFDGRSLAPSISTAASNVCLADLILEEAPQHILVAPHGRST